jgi:hypothetical protein
MPTVTIFHQFADQATHIDEFSSDLRTFVAKELSCGDRILKPEEVSTRLITTTGTGMIAPIEIEVTAHAFQERIDKQDEICLHIRDFVKQKLHNKQDVRVWLLLPQLGHSWE